MDITTAAPVEIDTVIAEHEERLAVLRYERDMLAKRLEDYRAAGAQHYAQSIERTEASLDTKVTEIRETRAAVAPFHAEYTRRGGWTRAFLVLNTGGHLHSSTACSTCFPTTRFGWLPQESGKTEAEIVDGAGADACTVCFPSAPVASLSQPRRTLHRTEVEAQQARDAKAAVKAEREAKKAAKALVIDLRPYGVDGYTGRIETVTGAKAYLTDAVQWNGWLASEGRRHPSYPAAAERAVAEALATKFGTTPEKEMADAAKRASKRR